MIVIYYAVAGLALLLLLHMIIEANRTNITHQSMRITGLGESFDKTQLFFISDIHRRKLRPEVIRRIRSKNRIELVLIGGDLTEKGVPFTRVEHNIKLLSELGPVYFVYGNHDYDVNYRKLDILLRQWGVRILDNDAVLLEKGTDSLLLVGVDDPVRGRDKLHIAYSEICMKPACTILLAHDPSIINKLMDGKYPADLILAGHTHGGQVCFPWLGAVYYSTNHKNRDYLAGRYEINGRRSGKEIQFQLFVSRGYGTTWLPIRLLCPSEAHVITLRSL